MRIRPGLEGQHVPGKYLEFNKYFEETNVINKVPEVRGRKLKRRSCVLLYCTALQCWVSI
jgi:hypothetical protein